MSERIYTEDEVDAMIKDLKSKNQDLSEKIKVLNYRIERIESLQATNVIPIPGSTRGF